MKKRITGKVWFGFVGEYQKPPCYIILGKEGFDADTVFISDVLKEFAGKEVCITIKENQK